MASRRRAKGLWLAATLLFAYIARSNQLPAEDSRQQSNDDDVARDDDALPDRPVRPRVDTWDELFAEHYADLTDPERVARRLEEEEEAEQAFSGRLEVVEHWPVKDVSLGQIGGIATDPEGYVYAFHRAGRPWTDKMFDKENVFTMKKDGAIKDPTLFKINATNGIVLDKLGANKFYIPHGLTIDSQGNKWMTDVAMHQVFKFEPGKQEPSLVLGKAFEPAKSHKDTERFCKPTDVGVASNGDIYITDGYCASRIMKFDKTGKFLTQFGLDDFQIPHSIAVIEELDLICAADREGMRVLCYNAGIKDASKLGAPEREYADDALGRVFAITYSLTDGVLYGVTGPSGVLLPQGFTIDMRDDERYKTDIIATWSPEDDSFDAPHDVAVSPDGEAVFVGEITNGNPLWKFVKEQQ